MPEHAGIHKKQRSSQKWSARELFQYAKTLLRFLRIDEHSHFIRAVTSKLKGRSCAQVFVLHAKMLRLYGTAESVVANLLRNYLGSHADMREKRMQETGLLEEEKSLILMLIVGNPLPTEYSHDMCEIIDLGDTSDEEQDQQ